MIPFQLSLGFRRLVLCHGTPMSPPSLALKDELSYVLFPIFWIFEGVRSYRLAVVFKLTTYSRLDRTSLTIQKIGA